MVTMTRKIEIPEDVEVEVTDEGIAVNGEGGEVRSNLKHPLVNIRIEGGKVVIETKKDNSKVESIAKTFESKVKNAIKGVQEGYEYRLKLVYRHFPVEMNVQGDKLMVSNFLGESDDREADILEGVEVEVDDEDIVVRGMDKERVGQTAANIERNIQAPNTKDRRVFEDGIYIVEKPGDEG